MSGILRLENLNKGTTLKQGDKTVLSYRLSDADGEQLNIAGETAVARLMHPDFTRIGYESEALTVSADNIVQFSIDSIIPSRLYYLEITVDGQYIFPSRSDEGKLSIDRSSMGAEITIIENAGIDAVVRKAVDLINQDPSLIIDEDKLISEIIANTSVGSIEEYYQQYRDVINEFADLKPKALSAVSKSQNALDVANGIDAKATNALNLSTSADTLSKSVQEQFNQVVIDGDSSVESAQARVTADGVIKSTLKQRLDDEHTEVTAHLAHNTEQVEFLPQAGGQRNFLELKRRHMYTLGENEYQINSDRSLSFKFPLSAEEELRIDFEKDRNDDFIKMRDFTIYGMTAGSPLHLNFDFPEDVVVGTLSGTVGGFPAANPYATAVGTKIEYTFEGTGIDLQHIYDTRGGVWRAEIDGEYAKDISTHQNAVPPEEILVSSVGKRPIARNLPNGMHTLTLTFEGDDPNYPPSSGAGTSRGWIKHNGYVDPATTNVTSFVVYPNEELGLKATLLQEESNKEFAIRIKKDGTSDATQWFPEHNNIGTAFVGESGYQTLLVDGQKVSMAASSELRTFKEAELVQVLEMRHPNQSEKLGEIYCICKIDREKVSFTATFRFTQDTYVETGYVNMLPAHSSFAQRCITGLGQVVESIKTDNSVTDFYEKDSSDGYAFVSSETEYNDYFVAVQMPSPYDTLRKGEPGRRNGNSVTGATWLQHRSDGIIQKLYPQVFQGGVTYPAGTSYTFEGDFLAGKIPNVAILLANV